VASPSSFVLRAQRPQRLLWSRRGILLVIVAIECGCIGTHLKEMVKALREMIKAQRMVAEVCI
jgi:hypothetical protein